MILGRREGSNVLLPEEKHAVASTRQAMPLWPPVSHGGPVAKVTILPAGQSLGVTEQLPCRAPPLRRGLPEHQPRGAPGWESAELVELGQGSTGRPTTWRRTELAVRMVREFGLSSARRCRLPRRWLGVPWRRGPGLSSRPFAEETQAKIDSEVSALLSAAEKRAVRPADQEPGQTSPPERAVGQPRDHQRFGRLRHRRGP